MAKEKICGVYKIENSVNGKYYIGSSNNIYRRWKEHIKLLNRNNHHSPHLQFAWNKYGEKNFKFSILEECDEEILLEKEQFYIDMMNATDDSFGYNTAPFADKPFLTEAGKIKMINGNKERFQGENSSLHKYSEDNIIKCIELLKTGLYTYKEISELTNVGIPAIKDVKNHRTWKYLTQDVIFPKPIRNVVNTQTLKYDDVKNIIQMMIDGKTNSEIAQLFNVSVESINQIRIGNSYKELTKGLNLPQSRSSEFTENEIKEIIQLLLDGKQNMYIANKFNVNKNRISEIRNHRSYTSYTKGIIFPKGNPKQTKFSGKQKEVIDYYNSHKNVSQSEIANAVGLEQSTISYTLNKFKDLLKQC